MKNTISQKNLPQRTESHEIDSLALRYIRNSLPPNWLDRNLSEQDYGIDLALEIFKNDAVNVFLGKEIPTGWFSLLQVKGTINSLCKNKDFVKFPNFPVKTLIYANQFKIPFYLIVVHLNKDKSKCYARYLWLQDYINRKGFGFLRSNWKTSKSITLYIPEENVFLNEDNKRSIEDSIKKDHFDKRLLEIIHEYYIIKHYTYDFEDVPLESVLDMWLHFLDSLKELSNFDLNELFDDVSSYERFNPEKIRRVCREVKKNNKISDTQIDFFNEQIELIEDMIDFSLGLTEN